MDITVNSISGFQKGKKGKKGKKEKDLTPDRYKSPVYTIYTNTLCMQFVAFSANIHIFDSAVLRTIESLYEELAREGIIAKCPKTRLSDFVGEYRYIWIDICSEGRDWPGTCPTKAPCSFRSCHTISCASG